MSSEEGEITTKRNNRFVEKEFGYNLGDVIGEGTFGKVYLGYLNGKSFALKKILYEKRDTNGFPLTTLREIKILKSLKHKNIIEIIEVTVEKKDKEKISKSTTDVYVVFPFMKQDLSVLIKNKKIPIIDIKFITKQIIDGLFYLHSHKIMHRDLKAANILLDDQLAVKIADFGLAIEFSENGKYTPGVVTLWYRSPELLLGSTFYDYSVDMWGLGCIISEMLTGRPIFPGKNEINQLNLIISICGSINKRTVPDIENFRDFFKFKLPQGIRNISKYHEGYDETAINLIDLLLNVNHDTRLTSEKAMNHPFVHREQTSLLKFIDSSSSNKRQKKNEDEDYLSLNNFMNQTTEFSFYNKYEEKTDKSSSDELTFIPDSPI
ncbi:protein kinase [Hamiltosporidium tvaerminnensis]|uniref:Protein kinase n=1 Tax=Hamiltosporidium tvaerminnensis TaxID=1176355 RepID=A0A4V2JXP4_9MICR|nr:protein kinase [Hamiltosporidium tvaerminnensis]